MGIVGWACPDIERISPSPFEQFIASSGGGGGGGGWLWRSERNAKASIPAVRRPSDRAMGRRILNDALRTMVNADRRGKATAVLQPISGVMVSFLNIMKHRGYIKNFEVIDPHRVGKINVELHGRIKDCKALTYRQDLRAKEIEQYRIRMLPTRQLLAKSTAISLPFLSWKVSKSTYPDDDYIRQLTEKFTLDWGYVVVTTPNGVLDHEEAIRQNVGGQVLGYFH
ncbi:hypothetical protein ACP4OV_020791 [Aristida adscensionis]